jgi:hypothetical protein
MFTVNNSNWTAGNKQMRTVGRQASVVRVVMVEITDTGSNMHGQ